MNLKRAIYLVVLLMGFASQQTYSQSYTPISGVINHYTSVTEILSYDVNNVDSVVVVSNADFAEGDTVMLYCVKGAVIGTDGVYPPGDENYPAGDEAQDPRSTGRYAFMIVQEVVNPNIVIFNTNVTPDIQPMEAGEVAQLIRVPSYRYANVTATGVGAPSWDQATGTGGVVAMFVQGVLRLDGDIDVSGDGFAGASGSTDDLYTNGCSSLDTLNYYENFYLDGELWAGLKGEGITDTMFPYNRGKASNINGGGGGNGLLSGGGGGSNYAAGARGGGESTACSPGVLETGGAGGFDLGRSGWYYVNSPDTRKNRIFFGGGGGSGTRTVAGNSTDGADGGGIVVIIADTIIGNGHWIRADGDDVSGAANQGGGGGGGGGGCVILDVAGYQTSLNLSAVGGDGGDSFGIPGSDTTGMGGAGGGGVYWLAGSTHTGVTPDYSTGINGTFISGIPYDPLESAFPPFKQIDLIAPLKGFLFNPVPDHFTICSDQNPDPIVASEPKGGEGTGTYSYQWIDSSKTQNFWDIAPLVSTEKDYDPGPLSDTTYYRRVVTSGLLIPDTSFRIAVYVHPAITGNTIAANDTVCSDNAPNLFVSAATIGGGPTGGSYTYKWQHRPDGDSFSDITAVSGVPTYQSPGLTTSTDYRRFAYAGVCVDTSNQQRVRVLETITGNDITPFDTICINTIPDLIDGPVPSNGDQDDLRYQWLTSTDPGVMGTTIPGATALSYQSPALSQTTYIQRIVLSGNDNACLDTSAYVEILNIPDITNNIITADQTVCQMITPDPLTGSSPGGGHLGQYTYTWISSNDQSSWIPAAGAGANDQMTNFDPGVMAGDTTWYRRVVESGGTALVCKDTSSSVVINVLPVITNNVVTPSVDMQCQWEMPEQITGLLPGGGATVAGVDPTRIYRWEVAQIEGVPGSSNWFYPSSGAAAQNYTDPNQLSTDVDRWYQRIVISGSGEECVDTSNLVHLAVHSEITANAIAATQAICFNDTRALRNIALTGGETGETPVYTWRSWLEGETSADAVPLAGSDQLQYMSGPYNDAATLIYMYDRVVEIGACRDTSNTMQVTVMQLPDGVLTDAGFSACEKETALQVDLNMAGLTAGHYEIPWSVYLKDGVHTGIGPGSFDQDTDTMGIIMDTDGADHQTYTYEIESISYYPEVGYDYACISENLTPSSVVVELYRRPDPQILVDGGSRESFKVCNTTALLEFVPDNGTLTSWSDPTGDVFFSPGSGTDEYNVSIPNNHDAFGEYKIIIQSEAGDCAGSDSIDLYFFEQPAPAGGRIDTFIYLIDYVQLKADPPTAGIGEWTLVGGSGSIEDINDPNTRVYNLGMDEENEFRWEVTNGEDPGTCDASNYVTIVRRLEVKKYNGFSPNGDMDNEYFIVQGLIYADEFEVTFLNALGNIVRTITHENIGEMEIDPSLITDGLAADEMVIWDGRSNNGNLVPSGTYYYVVSFTMGSGSDNYKDYVVVVRE